MYTVTKYPHGTFSWADNSSTNVEKARPFYTELMGWTVEETPMGHGLMYSFLKLDGHTAAAISPMLPDMEAQGMPSMWSTYITVDDIHAMVEKVTAAGGTVIAPPFQVFDSGWMMTVQDPAGAIINFWQPLSHIGAYIVNTPGAMVWNEMATRDVEKAEAFFAQVLGWTFDTSEPGYHYIHNNGRLNGGIVRMDENWGEIPPHWQVSFSVSDVDAVVEKAKALGGTIISGIDTTDVGRFAIINDPAGAMFAVIQLNQIDEWSETPA
jgi:uncharacterized protein